MAVKVVVQNNVSSPVVKEAFENARKKYGFRADRVRDETVVLSTGAEINAYTLALRDASYGKAVELVASVSAALKAAGIAVGNPDWPTIGFTETPTSKPFENAL